jgi:hypothetical protein
MSNPGDTTKAPVWLYYAALVTGSVLMICFFVVIATA